MWVRLFKGVSAGFLIIASLSRSLVCELIYHFRGEMPLTAVNTSYRLAEAAS